MSYLVSCVNYVQADPYHLKPNHFCATRASRAHMMVPHISDNDSYQSVLLKILLAITTTLSHSQEYTISDKAGFGRIFDGIGGLSAGASSKLLYTYREPQRSQLLDYLFKPKFGASLQILKVEIGGDDQSTDGVESSHMHDEWDESYDRGYEWWLMLEAKKRNPNIKLYALSWAFPGWLGTFDNPYVNLARTATYTAKWIQGAETAYNLTIDFIGIWNEKWCNLDYVIVLRRTLDACNLTRVKIVACDGKWEEFDPILNNATLRQSIAAYGVHYPGTVAPDQAVASNITLWSSEDYSTFADNIGAGCWARTLSQNYVNGYYTSTIAWSLIAAFYKGLVCEGDGLTIADEPWSGHYEVKNPIWITAHTTQFSEIGWRYLKHGYGVGKLLKGGSYLSLASQNLAHLTIVIETMTYNHSKCIYSNPPAYNLRRQKALFTFGGSFAKIKKMHLWKTQLDFSARGIDEVFKYNGAVEVSQGRLFLFIEPDTVYTLTTVSDGKKGNHGPSPPSSPFPLPYFDDFQNYSVNQEPNLLSPQTGVWEIRKDPNFSNQFARQVIIRQPVVWIALNAYPIAIIGDATWTDIALNASIRFPSVNSTNRVFLSLRARHPQCVTSQSKGIFFWLDLGFQSYVVTSDIAGLNLLDAGLLSKNARIQSNVWYNVSISVRKSNFSSFLNGASVTSFSLSNNTAMAGFCALGTGGWGHADFDNLYIEKA